MDAATSSTSTEAAAAIRGYATRCREVLPEGFQVRSYAGLWLLLAALGGATTGAGREELEEALGVAFDEAAAVAVALMDEERDDLDAGVAGWLRADVFLRRDLPVRLAALPDQAGLDAWADASTRGRIRAFPLTPTPETVLLLASALVTHTHWTDPLDVEDDRLVVDERGLLAVVDTVAAGLVAVAVPPGAGNLDVVSVIADPGLPASRVWAAVDEVTAWVLDGTLLERRVPAATLGAGHAWRVTRERQVVPEGPAELWDASVPTWRLDSSTDLRSAPGVRAVAQAILAMIPTQPLDVSCVQTANATYTFEGFEAAAVSVMAFMGSVGEPQRERKVHHVSLRSDRPHAVVALARDGAWEGVPLVHAWIDGETDPSLRPTWSSD